MARLQLADLVQIVPAAARLEAVGGPHAARIRAGIIELLSEACDVATLNGARQRLLQQVGEREDILDAETRIVDDAIRHAASTSASPRALVVAPDPPERPADDHAAYAHAVNVHLVTEHAVGA